MRKGSIFRAVRLYWIHPFRKDPRLIIGLVIVLIAIAMLAVAG